MSWTDAFKFTKSIAANKGFSIAKEKPRADELTALNARIGGVVTLQLSPFIRAQANGSLLTIPQDTKLIIKAISRVNLNMNGKIHRLYFANDDESNIETFLQIFTNDQGVLIEAMFCTKLIRIIPESVEEQDAFMGQSGVGLGELNYSLWKEQLEDIGIDKNNIINAFQNNENIVYNRDIGNSDIQFVPALTGTETRVDDIQGEHGLTQDIFFMSYVRDVGVDKEYLLISTEVVKSQDGDESRRSIHVDFMIGLLIDKERFVIQ